MIKQAVIFCGGFGKRLQKITSKIPKPMVDIGGVPLLERQIKKLSNVGIKKVYLAVNYLSNVIEDHFGNGDSHNIEINYLRENESLGTGGALSLLPENPSKPLLVMNGDVLTNSNFESLLKFHNDQENELTVATFSYNIDIPFGDQNRWSDCGQLIKNLLKIFYVMLVYMFYLQRH